MAFRAGLVGISVLVSACGGGQRGQTPDMGLPAWDGAHIVCNENVSFAADNGDALPDFPQDERLGFCARSMQFIELHRLYSGQTSYFGMAAATTASLAATYAPLVRRAYSESTWEFMANLGREVEPKVLEAAAVAQRGGLNRVLGGLARGALNTKDLVRVEQAFVQNALDDFAIENPEAYELLIEEVNGTFNPTNRLLIAAINRNPFFKAYEAGLAQIRLRHGGAINFAELEQRIEIAEVLESLINRIALES